MKAIVFWGGWDGHTPEQSVNVFIPWLQEQGYEVEVSKTLDAYLDEKKMMGLSLIVQCWTMGQITGEQRSGLLIGEVLAFHVDDALLAGNRVAVDRFHPIARLGGPNYATLGRIITQPKVGEAGPTENR